MYFKHFDGLKQCCFKSFPSYHKELRHHKILLKIYTLQLNLDICFSNNLWCHIPTTSACERGVETHCFYILN